MKVKNTLAQVERIEPLTDSIIELILNPQHYIDYKAGQYLKILSGDDALCYSIANAPLGSHKYELHIRHDHDNSSNQSLFAAIKQQGRVSLSLPFGQCYLEQLDPDKSIIFIAGGTGFAPMKAMIEQLLATGDKRPFVLYWGARSQSDLYMDDKVKQWQTHVPHCRYVALLPGVHRETLASLVIAHHQDDLLKQQIIISGPFDMVYATRDALVAFGVPRDQLYSDAFNFEVQEK